ncbi:glycosyltransferase [Humisphaera borealis]|uniref:Glycosyltransferase n=1 Tax=Humisphaera borealis TaxID=2807512 RepID=A0A7M2WYP8_9BACT|nr:glycosyltransferase [Humisphaera borealis]QOV90628.1 glycosyltransferase [Humisphaera borealis]
MNEPTRWAILTGEFPPQSGGVADYTSQLAAGLAAAGDDVRVYAPVYATGIAECRGVCVVRLCDHFGPRGLALLDRALALDPPDRMLIQYVPHAFGMKAMNLPFAVWIAARARRHAVWLMFHEVAFPFGWRPKHIALATAHRAMARLVLAAAQRVFVTVPGWTAILRHCGLRDKSAEWLPVPSNVPALFNDAEVEAIRARVLPSGTGRLVGHFGTFGKPITDILEPVLARLLRGDPSLSVLLFGRGSQAFLDRFVAAMPDWRTRVVAAGELEPQSVAAHIRACEVMVLPFPDGVSSRRTTAMAALSNGTALVSNGGHLTEPFWAMCGCIAMAPKPDPDGIAAATSAVLALPSADRRSLGARAADLYRSQFSVERVIERLRNPSPATGKTRRLGYA